jgi:hypothetical protein
MHAQMTALTRWNEQQYIYYSDSAAAVETIINSLLQTSHDLFAGTEVKPLLQDELLHQKPSEMCSAFLFVRT